ncbi:MAG TPA: TMEM175 family protein, partial [Woeseiaceae bacterium]|nr:TMEM175 family protein [Woeseiaceae bacterium]
MPNLASNATDRLSALPTRSGFRQRGMEMTRLETFTDAAFAFAVTLLVIGGSDSVPANFDEMLLALNQVPAFAASFANIMLFWYAHHIWSRRFGLEDTISILLSLLLIFVILIYVYPLKAIYSGAIEFFSNGYFTSYFGLRSLADLRDLFVIFGLGFA